MAESPSKLEAGKIFVGGLSWDTTKESLINYFSKYGVVDDGVIMVDSVTKLPRGFGFVTFKDPSVVSNVMETVSHTLDGKKIDPKEAITKDYHATSQACKNTSIDKKVFVGGIPHGCSVEEIKTFFRKFGGVVEVDIKMDKGTTKPRGFAFVEFEEKESADKACEKSYHIFKEKRIEVKPAENRNAGGSGSGTTAQYSQWSQSPSYAPGAVQGGLPPYQYGYQATPYGYSTAGVYPTQQPAQSYPPTQTAHTQPSYPQGSSYQSNGYPSYQVANASYPAPALSSAANYSQQSTAYSGGYPYPASYDLPTGYGQSTAGSSGYYSNNSSFQGQSSYSSDSRYPQPPNQRSW